MGTLGGGIGINASTVSMVCTGDVQKVSFFSTNQLQPLVINLKFDLIYFSHCFFKSLIQTVYRRKASIQTVINYYACSLLCIITFLSVYQGIVKMW